MVYELAGVIISPSNSNDSSVTKMEGAKTNTYKRLPITKNLLLWSVPDGVGVQGPTE